MTPHTFPDLTSLSSRIILKACHPNLEIENTSTNTIHVQIQIQRQHAALESVSPNLEISFALPAGKVAFAAWNFAASNMLMSALG